MKIAFVIFLLPILVFASVQRIFGYGSRRLDDRAFIVHNATLLPNENQTILYYFEYLLEGKYFTALTIESEPIYVSQICHV